MDEHVPPEPGAKVRSELPFSDVNLQDLTFCTDKHNRYATHEVIEVLNQRYGLLPRAEAGPHGSAQAGLKRQVKEGVYNKIPYQLAALGYFLYATGCSRGSAMALEGLFYHALQGG